jgi:predicted nucleic acid-binding protein
LPDESSSYADAALAVAEREGLTAYDAAYVDLALREKLVLATLDGPMRKAAEQFGVTVFRPQGPTSAQ